MDASWILFHLVFMSLPLTGLLFVIYTGSKMYKFCKENLRRKILAKSDQNVARLNQQLTLNLIIQVWGKGRERGRKGTGIGHRSMRMVRIEPCERKAICHQPIDYLMEIVAHGRGILTRNYIEKK